MINTVLIAFALILGYSVAVGLLMIVAFGVAWKAPGFVVKDYRIRKRYKVTEELAWLLCATAGGYVAATVSGRTWPWLVGGLLATGMIVILWRNHWEMRQRGILHQMLMSVISVVGVAAGFVLRFRILSA
jgi:hypothetical protein